MEHYGLTTVTETIISRNVYRTTLLLGNRVNKGKDVVEWVLVKEKMVCSGL